jgi:ketosteroid isomerase-like protein
MSPNKQAVRQYMEAFDRLDHAAVLAVLTDDVEWVVPGAYAVRGKAAFDAHIEGDDLAGRPGIVVTRLTEQDDVVVAEGRVSPRRKDGSTLHLAFCDVFEMRGGRVRRLTSYLARATP